MIMNNIFVISEKFRQKFKKVFLQLPNFKRKAGSLKSCVAFVVFLEEFIWNYRLNFCDLQCFQ
jgi:hypothetical protein